MPVPSIIVRAARFGWNWQWQRLMNGLGPSDYKGNYVRPDSEIFLQRNLEYSDFLCRERDQQAFLIIGRSCPWAHRTWLMHSILNLGNTLNIKTA